MAASTEQRELELVEKVYFRILSVANNEEKLQNLLKVYLTPVILKLGSEYASVRNKVLLTTQFNPAPQSSRPRNHHSYLLAGPGDMSRAVDDVYTSPGVRLSGSASPLTPRTSDTCFVVLFCPWPLCWTSTNLPSLPLSSISISCSSNTVSCGWKAQIARSLCPRCSAVLARIRGRGWLLCLT